jgi:Zn-dependent protease
MLSLLSSRNLDFTTLLITVLFMTAAYVMAIYVHEGNHALVATALGDDTPRRAGRLSFNPLRHVDRTGLIIFVIAGFGWGWTPVNPRNLRPDPRIGNALVAAAGPLANLALAFALSLPLRAGAELPPLLHQFLFLAAALNLLLFVLNLIPIPPLDGFTVLLGLLPAHLAAALKPIERAGVGLIFALLFLPSLMGVDVLRLVYDPVSRLFGLASLR